VVELQAERASHPTASPALGYDIEVGSAVNCQPLGVVERLVRVNAEPSAQVQPSMAIYLTALLRR
jgi:hypothetical protein